MSARKPGLRGIPRAIAVVALILCLSGSGILGYLAWVERQDRRTGEAFYAALVDHAARMEAARAETDAGGESLEAPSSAPDMESVAVGQAAKAAQEPSEGAGEPVLIQAAGSQMDFDGLRQMYRDVVGWIRLEDSRVNYPIVQGEDNVYYLNHLPDGTQNEAGSILLDRANTPDFSDEVSILHGHHMESGAMFGEFEKYADESYFRAHPEMMLFTPEGDYRVQIFAACTVDGETFDYPTAFADEADFEAFVDEMRRATPYETQVEVAYGERLLLLSTCAYSFREARFVVVGKLLD